MLNKKIIAALIIASTSVYGADNWFYGSGGYNWFYYDDPKPMVIESMSLQRFIAGKSETQMSAKEKINAIKDYAEEVQDQAILDPTPANVLKAQQTQRKILLLSAKYGEQWQVNEWQQPDSFTSFHPWAGDAFTADKNERSMAIRKTIDDLATKGGLFFFFGHNERSQQEAYALSTFQQIYNVKILAISTDGSTVQGFPDAKPDNGIVAKLGVKDTPAIFAFDGTKAIPITYGFVGPYDLGDRLYRILNFGIDYADIKK